VRHRSHQAAVAFASLAACLRFGLVSHGRQPFDQIIEIAILTDEWPAGRGQQPSVLMPSLEDEQVDVTTHQPWQGLAFLLRPLARRLGSFRRQPVCSRRSACRRGTIWTQSNVSDGKPQIDPKKAASSEKNAATTLKSWQRAPKTGDAITSSSQAAFRECGSSWFLRQVPRLEILAGWSRRDARSSSMWFSV